MTNETRQLLGWLALPVAAVVNGGLRDVTYGKRMGRTASHSLAVLPLIVAILTWASALERRWPLPSRRAAVRVGLLWLGLTLVFEFGMGAVRGTPREELLAEYDVRRGHLWPLVLPAAALAPLLAHVRAAARG